MPSDFVGGRDLTRRRGVADRGGGCSGQGTAAGQGKCDGGARLRVGSCRVERRAEAFRLGHR